MNLAEQWASFTKLVPKDASEIQRTEMRRAFMAGAASVLSEVVRASQELTEDEACKVLDDLLKELREFAQGELARATRFHKEPSVEESDHG